MKPWPLISRAFEVRTSRPIAMKDSLCTISIRSLILQSLRENWTDDVPAHVGQPEMTALEFVSQFGVIDAQAVEHRGVQIVHVHAILDHVVAEVVRLSMREAAFHAASCHP